MAPSAASPAPAVARVPTVWACLPAAPLVVCWLVWVPLDGGYFPRQWYPGALIALGVLVATAAGLRRVLPAGRAVRVALIALAVLTALQYASLLWTDAPGDAWEAANQLLLALATAWTFALLPWTPARLAAVAATWATGVAIICLDRLLVASSATSLGRFFDPTTSRWQSPIGYPNAAAALAAVALIAALVCSSRSELPAWARVPLVGAAAFLAQFALLPQTRAAIVGLAAAAVAIVVADGRRRRLIPRMLVVGGAVAWTASRVIDVGQAAEDGKPVGALIDTATRRVVVVATVVAIVAAGLIELVEYLLARRRGDAPPRELPVLGLRGRADRRRRRPARGGRGRDRRGAGPLPPGQRPRVLGVERVGRRQREVAPAVGRARGAARLRPRGAADVPRAARARHRGGVVPIHYDRLRKYEKHSRYEHMIFLRVLGETGIVGLLALPDDARRPARGVHRRPPASDALGPRDARAGARARGLPARARLAGLDRRVRRDRRARGGPGLRRRRDRPPAVAGSRSRSRAGSSPRRRRRAVVAALLVLVPPYLSDRYVRRALNSYRAHPDQALRDTERAASANPLSLDPLVTEGTICLQIRRFACAEQAFEAAAAQQDNWYSWLELGLLDARAGRRAEALRDLAHARQLSRVDPMVAEARS